MLCMVFSKAMFTTYENEKVMTSDGNLYLLQYGSYINHDVLMENIKKLDNYLIYEMEDKYYVYIGAFTDLENARDMQKKYENKGIYTYLKNDYYGNSKLINQIKDYESKFKEANDSEKEEITKKILNLLKTI